MNTLKSLSTILLLFLGLTFVFTFCLLTLAFISGQRPNFIESYIEGVIGLGGFFLISMLIGSILFQFFGEKPLESTGISDNQNSDEDEWEWDPAIQGYINKKTGQWSTKR